MTDSDDESSWPAPVNDGACNHLPGASLPAITLASARRSPTNLQALEGLTVLYFYPMTGADNAGLPAEWDMIPGARGCSPQACGFRDLHDDLIGYGATVFGVATQAPEYLEQEIDRLRLPYDLLSDEHLLAQRALKLPLMPVKAAGRPVFRRFTVVCQNSLIIKVFYPVFPPSANAGEVLSWLDAAGLSRSIEQSS